MNDFFKYGEEVVGYDVRVVNEQEARAQAEYEKEAAAFDSNDDF